MIRHLPSALSSARLAAAPALALLIVRNHWTAALACFACIAASDLLDGPLARALHVASPRGARLDIAADLGVVLCGFGAFAILSVYPWWLLLVFGAMFAQFVITSRHARRPIYDPIGKYYGAVLFAVLGVTLAVRDGGLIIALTSAVLAFTVIAIASRMFRLLRAGRRDADPALPRHHLSGYS
ncbi:MAG TPA: CDP-alcohol phosphatidyltransferase family protein [Gemmatimonadales bacterium]|nr:CDP-alcohol phosphatidyltransferase family protein [Gemmatimonadales bacterium]